MVEMIPLKCLLVAQEMEGSVEELLEMSTARGLSSGEAPAVTGSGMRRECMWGLCNKFATTISDGEKRT